MAQLACQHRNLAAMVRVVRYQIAEETDNIRLKTFDISLAGKRSSQRGFKRLPTGFERLNRFGLCDSGRVQFLGKILRPGSLEPHQPDVVDMSNNGRDVAALAAGRFAAP